MDLQVSERYLGVVTMCAVIAALQHLKKAVHKVRVLVGKVVRLGIYLCMKIKEINDHRLHGIERQVEIKTMLFLCTARTHVLHILFASLCLPRVEVHDRIVEEHHMSACAVIAERQRHLDKFRRDIDGNGLKIRACIGYLRVLASLHNDTIAALQRERRAVEKQRRGSLQAQSVRQVTRVRELQIRG